MLTIYAEKQGFNDLAIYTDKGESGIKFERPSLLQLLSDIETGMVDTVIVYSFSRFSRNALEMGRFIESVFPKYGVRFISVMDGFDSDEYENIADYTASVNPIRAILNLYNQLAGKAQTKIIPLPCETRKVTVFASIVIHSQSPH